MAKFVLLIVAWIGIAITMTVTFMPVVIVAVMPSWLEEYGSFIEEFASFISIVTLIGLITALAVLPNRRGEKRGKEARRLEAEQRVEEQWRLGEAKRLETKRQAEEKRKLQETARLQEEARRERHQEEIKKQNEEEEKRLREEREQKQAEKLIQPRKPGLMAMIVMQHERAQQETDPDVKSYLMREVQDLQKSLGNTRALAEELIGELAEIVRTAFLVKNCPRCHENKMALIEVSPNAKSIEYACVHCGRRQRAAATSPDAARAKTLEKFIVAVLGKTWFKTLRHGYRCTFLTPEATLPYERPTRELIPEAMRAQVWRRDDGRCVQCGSRENLHIDHIVPVSRGGATSVPNLQVLCQSCNLSKGAKI